MKNTRKYVLTFTCGLIVGVLADKNYVSTILSLATLLIIILMFSDIVVWGVSRMRKNKTVDKNIGELWWIERTYSLLQTRDKLQMIVSVLDGMIQNGKVELFNTEQNKYLLKITRTVADEVQVFWIPVMKVTEQLRKGMNINWDELYSQRILTMDDKNEQ